MFAPCSSGSRRVPAPKRLRSASGAAFSPKTTPPGCYRTRARCGTMARTALLDEDSTRRATRPSAVSGTARRGTVRQAIPRRETSWGERLPDARAREVSRPGLHLGGS
jgi:hypothetical protein